MANSITRQLLIQEATRRGWAYRVIGAAGEILRIDNGHKTISFMGSRPDQSSANGRQITISKALTLAFVESLGYAVPAYQLISSPDQLASFLENYTPIVIKPADSGQSKGVTVGISTQDEAAVAYHAAQQYSDTIVAQQQIGGKLYRIFVLHGSVPVVTERSAATVMGDGVRTVEQLIITLNQDPRRGEASDTPMKRVDPEKARQYLGDKLFHTVLLDGQHQRVGAIESVSEGGEARNCTDEVHSGWIEVAVNITNALGLFVAGFDIMTEDIASPPPADYLPLLEINSMPGLKIHEFPSRGEPVSLASMLLDKAFE